MTINTDFTNLTFDKTKQDIIKEFSNSEIFKDYDFTGSRLNVLVDVLAYAVTFDGAYANASLFESYLQYARKRESVVACAQNLGYLPSSIKASEITLRQTFNYTGTASFPSELKVPKGFKYTGKLNDKTYNFVVSQDTIILPSSDVVFSGDLRLVQGKFLRSEYNWKTDTRIFLKDSGVDRNYISITVNGEYFTLSDNAARTASNEKVFYMRETIEGWSEIYFGLASEDDTSDLYLYVGGVRPATGDSVVVEYLITNGSDANNISIDNIKPVDSITNFKTAGWEVSSLVPDGYSFGGGAKEDIERIRTVAPLKQEAQGRCVTVPDYKSFILNEFGPLIDNINVWTEKGVPGKAYYSIKPVGSLTTTNNFINSINAYLKKYNVCTITPYHQNPIYIFVDSVYNIDFDPTLLKTSEVILKQNIINSVQTYFKDNINDFGKAYYNSRVLSVVDNSDPSILGSACDVVLIKEIPTSLFWNMVNPINTATNSNFPTESYRSLFSYPGKDATSSTPEYSPSRINYKIASGETISLRIESTDGTLTNGEPTGKLVIGPQTPIEYTPTNISINSSGTGTITWSGDDNICGIKTESIESDNQWPSLLQIGSIFKLYIDTIESYITFTVTDYDENDPNTMNVSTTDELESAITWTPEDSTEYFSMLTDLYFNKEYTGTDFNGADEGIWYEVGTINYSNDSSSVTAGTFYIFKLDPIVLVTNVINPNTGINHFIDDYVKLTTDISESDIYPGNGELIVFEPYIRPEYIQINLNPITK
jgi:hypothetical protein